LSPNSVAKIVTIDDDKFLFRILLEEYSLYINKKNIKIDVRELRAKWADAIIVSSSFWTFGHVRL